MELILNTGFYELSMDEMNLIDGGKSGWYNFTQALCGTLLIAASPIVACISGPAALGTLGGGIYILGNIG